MVLERMALILISLLGIGGFLLALHIHKSKKRRTTLVCPFNGKCDQVIHSNFSKFFGVPVEYIGMLHYFIITIVYAGLFFFGNIMSESMCYFIVGLTAAAFFFSVYLTALQMFVLKSWCTWCLFSAFVCTAIFILVLISTELTLKEAVNPFGFIDFL